MSRNSTARSTSRWLLRNLLIDVATFAGAAAIAQVAGLLALGLFLTVPYFVSSSTEMLAALTGAPATTTAAPTYVWWVAIIAGLIVGLRICVLVFWKVEPTVRRCLHDRFAVQPPSYPLDNTDTY